MKQDKYLYFRGCTDEDNVAISEYCIPARSVTGIAPVSNTSLDIYFKSMKTQSVAGVNDEINSDKVRLIIAEHTHKKAIDAIVQAINGGPHDDGFIVIGDDVTTFTDNSTRAVGEYLAGTGISAVTPGVLAGVTPTITAVAGGTSFWYSYGAGALSTEVAPTYEQTRKGQEIISTIKVDLTGLACKGDAANDVIGLAAGGAAYIGKYTTGAMGIIYKAEVLALEVPGEGTSTITTDIDVAFNASATLEYDGAAGTAEINTGGFSYVGDGYSGPLTATGAAANDYIYLVEGDNAATTGVYNAGKLVINLYGRGTF
tara:strand:+ start:15 stop:956 length:942 start_codon:yes stop_codon:yes gene_type:complete